MMDYVRTAAMFLGILGLVLTVPWAFAWDLSWVQLVVSVVCIGLILWGDDDAPADPRPRGYGLPKRWD